MEHDFLTDFNYSVLPVVDDSTALSPTTTTKLDTTTTNSSLHQNGFSKYMVDAFITSENTRSDAANLSCKIRLSDTTPESSTISIPLIEMAGGQIKRTNFSNAISPFKSQLEESRDTLGECRDALDLDVEDDIFEKVKVVQELESESTGTELSTQVTSGKVYRMKCVGTGSKRRKNNKTSGTDNTEQSSAVNDNGDKSCVIDGDLNVPVISPEVNVHNWLMAHPETEEDSHSKLSEQTYGGNLDGDNDPITVSDTTRDEPDELNGKNGHSEYSEESVHVNEVVNNLNVQSRLSSSVIHEEEDITSSTVNKEKLSVDENSLSPSESYTESNCAGLPKRQSKNSANINNKDKKHSKTVPRGGKRHRSTDCDDDAVLPTKVSKTTKHNETGPMAIRKVYNMREKRNGIDCIKTDTTNTSDLVGKMNCSSIDPVICTAKPPVCPSTRKRGSKKGSTNASQRMDTDSCDTHSMVIDTGQCRQGRSIATRTRSRKYSTNSQSCGDSIDNGRLTQQGHSINSQTSNGIDHNESTVQGCQSNSNVLNDDKENSMSSVDDLGLNDKEPCQKSSLIAQDRVSLQHNRIEAEATPGKSNNSGTIRTDWLKNKAKSESKNIKSGSKRGRRAGRPGGSCVKNKNHVKQNELLVGKNLAQTTLAFVTTSNSEDEFEENCVRLKRKLSYTKNNNISKKQSAIKCNNKNNNAKMIEDSKNKQRNVSPVRNKPRNLSPVHNKQIISSQSSSTQKKLRSSKAGKCEPGLGLDEIDEFRKIREEFRSEEEYQHYIERQDHLLAQKLQADYNLEAKYCLNSIRLKGSENQYSLRHKDLSSD